MRVLKETRINYIENTFKTSASGKEITISKEDFLWLFDQAKKAERLEEAIIDINDAVSFYEKKGYKVKNVVEYFSAKASGNICYMPLKKKL